MISAFKEGGGLFNDCLCIQAQYRISSCRNEPRQRRGSTLLIFANKKDIKNSLGVFRKSQRLSHNAIKKKDPDQMNDRDPRRRRRPTLPPVTAVPSAQTGLTSLFGMERGGPRRHGHLDFSLSDY